MEWDVTALIRNARNYEVTFTYKSGAHRLAMHSVELLAGARSWPPIRIWASPGGIHSGNIYTLKIPPSAPGSVYTLRAEVRSEGGTDSNGEIHIRQKR